MALGPGCCLSLRSGAGPQDVPLTLFSLGKKPSDTSNQQSSILAFLLPLSKHLLSLVFLYSRGVRVLPGLTLNPPCLHPLQSLMPKEKQENKLKKKVGVSRKNPAAPCGLNITRYLTRGGHNMLFHIHAVLCFCKLFLLHRMLYPMCCYHP